MKRLFALLLAAFMVLSLAACGKEPTNKPSDTENTKPAQPGQTVPATDNMPDNEYRHTFTQFGNAVITIRGAEFTEDDWGDPVLRVYFDYTNTGTSAYSAHPVGAMDFLSVTQEGKELSHIYFDESDDCAVPADLNCDSPVQPGLTSRQTMLFTGCDPNGGIVEISCYIMIGSWVYNRNDIEAFTFQIDPDNMMGVPEPLEMAPITTPTYAVGLPTSGTNEECEMSIDGWELTKGHDGEDILRVKLTVTNNCGHDAMPMVLTGGVEVYQDGLALPWFSEWDLDDTTAADEAYNEYLDDGATVECNALFRLRSTSPAEVVIEDLEGTLRLGMICDVEKVINDRNNAQQEAENQVNAQDKAILQGVVGYWDRINAPWPDHIFFEDDGTGIHDMSTDEFPFSYCVEDGILYLEYDDGEEAEYAVTVEGDTLTLTDPFDNKQTFVRADSEAPAETDPAETEPEENYDPDQLVGYWLDVDAGENESFTFEKDGTGVYTWQDETYGFEYEVDEDYLEIYFDDGDYSDFSWCIEEDGRLNLWIGEDWYLERQ